MLLGEISNNLRYADDTTLVAESEELKSLLMKVKEEIEKVRVPEKQPLHFVDYAKAFDYVDHNKLWKILKEIGIPDHLTCLLRNLYAGQLELDMEQQTGSK